MSRSWWFAHALLVTGAAGCSPNRNLADLDRRLAEEHDRLDAFAARQHVASCGDPEGCRELMQQRCAAGGPFWVPAGVVEGRAEVAWDCVFDGAGQAEWARTQPFPVAEGTSAQATCDARRGEHEIAFVAQAQDPGMVYCVFYEGEGERPTRCPEGQPPEACRKAEEKRCWDLRHERTREQFSYMTTERLPVDRPVRVSVYEALGDHGVGELGHYVVADCGLEDDEEYAARRQPPRDANCLAFPACRFHAKERELAENWEMVERMRRRSQGAGSSAPRDGATREAGDGDGELREGLWVYDLSCTAEPDAGACASKTTICFTRSSGRLVGRVTQRSTVLKDNGVPVHTRKYDLDEDTLSGSAVVVLPHLGTACRVAAYHETAARATRVPAGPLGSIHIEYQNHRRDDGTCVLVAGETSTDILYKATAGDSSCTATPVMIGPTWVPDPSLRGGGVN